METLSYITLPYKGNNVYNGVNSHQRCNIFDAKPPRVNYVVRTVLKGKQIPDVYALHAVYFRENRVSFTVFANKYALIIQIVQFLTMPMMHLWIWPNILATLQKN